MDAFEASDVDEIRRLLMEFFDTAHRELPWRGAEDPYHVWVSEVMLQQTRVETVIPYYRRWLERFPTLESLADAQRDEVLQLWKGLGYYRRARNLHRAADVVRERFGGELPDTVERLTELPGVGDYTAGAVASIAFSAAVPAVDGNVRRVLARLCDLPDPTARELRERARVLLDSERPGDFNQALMELGAQVCTPSSPSCGRCPVNGFCLARARGTVDERPPPRRRGPVPEVEAAVAVLVDEVGRTVVRRRPDDGLLGGMWEFPTVEPDGDVRSAEAAARAAAEVGAAGEELDEPRALEPVSHAFTHLKMLYRPFLLRAASLPDFPEDASGSDSPAAGERGAARRSPSVRALPLDGLDAVPLPVAQQKIARRARRALAGAGDHAAE